MKIESVELFYLAMPTIQDVGDGSQDALLVRVQAGGYTGWGECEAAPLPSIAAWLCPMSHSACKPVCDSVLGQQLDRVEDIRRIHALVRKNSFDLLQADHMLSGIDVALWDLLGKRLAEPVWRLLGCQRTCPKIPYASELFANDPAETYGRAYATRQAGYVAAKFGWGPYGHGSVEQDDQQVSAAREGLGKDGLLMVDAGTVWGDDVNRARLRLPAIERCRVLWLEEPFVSEAMDSYRALASECGSVRLAGGEGCHCFLQAKNMVDYAAIRYLQIDAGRIGGITAAKQAADYAKAKRVSFVNHTFTSHLALSASLQPYADAESSQFCEYPVALSPLARELTLNRLIRDAEGMIRLPDAPGLGVVPNPETIHKYLVDVEIRVGGKQLYRSPSV